MPESEDSAIEPSPPAPDLSGTSESGDHRGALAVLGPPLPRNPVSRLFLAGKAAAACALALVFDRLSGNPDHVTSTFVAVLSVSPVVLMGLRRSFEQVVGSLLGGLWGTAAALAGLPLIAGIPTAVGVAILSCFLVGFGRGYTVAAFSALFVQAVPRGEPLATLEVRLLAVATAALAAFVVNVLVSSIAYRGIFRRRLRYAEATVSKLLVAAAERGPLAVRPGCPVLAELESQLEMARSELRWRSGIGRLTRHERDPRGAFQAGSRRSASWLAGISYRTGVLRRLLHQVLDLSYLLEEHGLPPDAAQPWLRWLVCPGDTEPPVPAPLADTTRRIRRIGRTLRPRHHATGTALNSSEMS